MKEKKRLMVSHIDLDGVGSVILAHYIAKHKPEIAYDNIMMLNYGFADDPEVWKEVLSYDIVHITDISVSVEQYQELLDNCKEVLLFDHHESSEDLKKFDSVTHDMTRCGTQIYFDEYFRKQFSRTSKMLSHIVELINVYDIWKLEDPLREEAVNFNRVFMGSRDWNATDSYQGSIPFIEKVLTKLEKLTEWRWLAGEQKIIDNTIAKEEAVYHEGVSKLSVRKDYKGLVFGLVPLMSKISIVASRILTEIPELDYLIIMNTYIRSEGNISFRSAKDVVNGFDIHPFKGHAQAAGGALPIEDFEKVIADETLCFKYLEDYKEGESLFTNCLEE